MQAQTVRRILDRAEAAVTQLAAQTENDPKIRRSQAAMFTEFAETYGRLGATDLAASYARQAVDLTRELAAKDPENGMPKSDLAVALIKLGSVQIFRGDRPGALAA
jgi:Flp pilus assembly protein TadD